MAAAGNGGGWSAVPHRLLDGMGDPGGKGRVAVYLLIHRHGNGSAEGCWASLTTLSREAGMSRRSVVQALRWLVTTGWIRRQAAVGRSTRYYLAAGPPTPPGGIPSATGGQISTGGSMVTAPMSKRHRVGEQMDTATRDQRDPGTSAPEGTRTRTQQQQPNNKIPSSSRDPSPPFSLCPPGTAERCGEPGGDNLCGEPPPGDLGRSTRPRDFEGGGPKADRTETDVPTAGEPIPEPHWGPPPPPPLPPPARADHLPVPVSELPPGLQCLADRIEDYWLSKAGGRSRQGFSAMLEELNRLLPRAGQEGVSQLLRQATQAGWPTLNGEAWLLQHREELAMRSNPAYRVFRPS